MTKPFDLEELCARMRAAMQRRSKEQAKPIISHGDITLDPASHVVTLKKKEVMVFRREFALLQKITGKRVACHFTRTTQSNPLWLGGKY